MLADSWERFSTLYFHRDAVADAIVFLKKGRRFETGRGRSHRELVVMILLKYR